MVQQEEKNINDQKLIESAVYSAPLSLLGLKNENLIKLANNFLPYSVGMEIECDWKEKEYKDINNVQAIEDFKSIPYILDVNCDITEKRFRIPNGIIGLFCLFNICEKLKQYCALSESGIHLHIDMTDSYHKLNNDNVKENAEWILKELDTWNYPGTYNSRNCTFTINHHWIRFQYHFKTAEIRICEMSFNYKVLVKRIIHANNIIKKLKENIGANYPISFTYQKFNQITIEKILTYIKDNYVIDSNNEYQIRLSIQNQLKERIVKMYDDD
jgi:hypothetical protein